LNAIADNKLVYVDEVGIEQCLYREHARAPRGKKVIDKISGRKFKRANIVAGICNGKWVSPLQYDCATDSTLFEYWFEHYLLNEVEVGSIIILDNATFHRKTKLPALAHKHDCEILFLPPYSPDLNPIEKKWAWLKQKLRSILRIFDSFDAALWSVFQLE